MVGAWSAAVCSWVKDAWLLSAIGMVGAVVGCRDTPSGAATAAAPPIVTVAKPVTQTVTDYLTFPVMRAHSPALREGLHEGRGWRLHR